jgi:hypothetical protein
VEEDGTIPAVELPNWTQPGLNNFRQNKQPGLEFAAPDAIVSVRPACDGQSRVLVEARNVGQSSLPAGAKVSLFKGDAPGALLAEQNTTRILYPGQAEILTFEVNDPDVQSNKQKVYAAIAAPDGKECRTDNNTSPLTAGSCDPQIQ